MEMSREKGMEMIEELRRDGAEEKPTIQVTPTITETTFLLDGWQYKCLFYKGDLVKIESYNHRELLEVYIK